MGGVSLNPEHRARKMQERFQLQRCVSELKPIPVAEQKLPVVEHIQVPCPVMEAPNSLRLHRAFRQAKHHSPYPPLVAAITGLGIAVHQSRNPEGEQKAVLVEKIERDQADPRAQVKLPRSRKAKLFHGNGERRWLGRPEGGFSRRIGFLVRTRAKEGQEVCRRLGILTLDWRRQAKSECRKSQRKAHLQTDSGPAQQLRHQLTLWTIQIVLGRGRVRMRVCCMEK